MKILGFEIRSFILGTVFFVTVGFGTNARALDHSYLVHINSKTLTDLSTLSGAPIMANDINDAGQVVGGYPRLTVWPTLLSPDPTGRA